MEAQINFEHLDVYEDDVVLVLKADGSISLFYRKLSEEEEQADIIEIPHNKQLGVALIANLQDEDFVELLVEEYYDMTEEVKH